MSYIGKKPTSSFASATSQTFTGNNSTTSFTLNRRVSRPEDLEVFVSNIQQQPTTSYTIGSTGLALNFDSAPPSGQFYVVYRSEAGTSAIDVGAARTANANTFSAAQTFSGGISGNTTFSGALSGTTGTFSGDLTVDTTTLKVDTANNRVGIGTASPAFNTEISNASTSTTLTGLTDAQLVLVNTGTATANQFTKLGFRFADGNYNGQAMIAGVRESATSRATALALYSAPSSDGDPDERVRINSSGNVGINTDDPHSFLDIAVNAFDGGRRFGVGYNDNIVSIYSHSGTGGLENLSVRGDNLYFYTDYDAGNVDGVERMRIKSNGRILAGDAGSGQSGVSLLLGNDYEEGYSVSSSSSAQLQKGGKTFILKDSSVHNTDTNIFWSPRNTGWSMFYWNKVDNGGSDRRYVDLYWNGSSKGSIKYSTSGTIDYNTSSDYRLKDNIKDKDVDSLYDDVKKLKVRTFKFKKDAGESTDDTVGFIAHEVQEVFPQLCDTPKDAMKDDIEGFTKDADGNPAKVPDYQDLDYGKFTPFIIGALQKAMEKIETLEAKVAELESK